MDRNQEFAGKRVLVTGAGKGIGYATALLLARRGAAVIALSRSLEDLEALDEAIGEPHGCEIIAVDIAETEFLLRALAHAHPIDLLVNCAGVAAVESFLDTSLEDFDKLMAVNVRASMLIAQECARGMIARGKGGSIVNVSSMAAQVGTPLHAAYGASKAALDALTRVMAVELGVHGIRANTVNPVITLTPMAEKVWSEKEKSGPMLARIPLGRFVKPEEVANVIAFLLSDESSMVNGVSLAVDGGFQAG